MIKVSPARKAFVIVNYIFCIIVAFVCIMPVIHVLAVSFSSKDPVLSGRVTFWPLQFTLDSYGIIVRDSSFYRSYLVTFERVLLGLAVNTVMTVLAAYPLSLSQVRFPARKYFTWYFMGTILFSGGMIPTYLVVKETGLYDNIFSLIVPGAVPVYNIILMMNFMKGLPDAISEASYIDGAGHMQTLAKIIIPLCKPSIATVSLFTVLSHWNAWFDGMIYIKTPALKPLQTYLRSIIIVDASISDVAVDLEDMIANVNSDSTNGAKIFLAMLPVLIFYPFVQKHFAKGIVRGSVKD